MKINFECYSIGIRTFFSFFAEILTLLTVLIVNYACIVVLRHDEEPESLKCYKK